MGDRKEPSLGTASHVSILGMAALQNFEKIMIRLGAESNSDPLIPALGAIPVDLRDFHARGVGDCGRISE